MVTANEPSTMPLDAVEDDGSAYINRDIGPDAPLRKEVGGRSTSRPSDLDVGLHPDLHACLVADLRGDELVAGGP